MLVKNFFYAINRIFELGFTGLIATLQRRLYNKIWYWRMHHKATAGTANHSWATIVPDNKFSFEYFFAQIQHKKCAVSMLHDAAFRSWLPTHEVLVHKADMAVNHVFDLLGSGPTQLGEVIDWHHDFKKNNVQPPFTNTDSSFSYSKYSKIFHSKIPVPQRGTDRSMYYEDIKVLWDLARMHHITALAMAYAATGEQKYVAAFVRDITSFQDQVSYLLGPHWKCPMDVAIRAINLVWALELFSTAIVISAAFWQRYTEMLYDHLVYLEWNFEESDKPNNHLLADYVGYLYLALFFRSLPGGERRLAKIVKTTARGFEHQILPDGTAYEGSTAYHRLDCELLLHTTTLLRVAKIPDEGLEKLLLKMLTFLAALTDQGGNLVTIGDDDSGTIVFGLHSQINNSITARTAQIFPDFGIGTIRTPRLHATLRAPVPTTNRPSGHIHHDALSMTLSIDGKPIFVDPGSFVYTANAWWRHFFKAPHQHSTFFLENQIIQNKDLFQTTLPYTAHSLLATNDCLQATTTTQNASLTRSMSIADTTITLYDTITTPNNLPVKWCFIVHPSITVACTNDCYTLNFAGHPIATLTSSLKLSWQQNKAFATGYGCFLPTQALYHSTSSADITGTQVTTITVL